MTALKQNRGKWGELRAEAWLKERQFEILARNLRAPREFRAGEIDILARQRLAHGAVVDWIVEVKTRDARSAADAPLLDPRQLARLHRARVYVRSRAHEWAAGLRNSAGIGVALLWVRYPDGDVAFLENPCYRD